MAWKRNNNADEAWSGWSPDLQSGDTLMLVLAVLGLVALLLWAAYSTLSLFLHKETIWPDSLFEEVELYGENPSVETLRRAGITGAYDANGTKVLMENTATTPSEGPLYTSEDCKIQYIYYDGVVYTAAPDMLCDAFRIPRWSYDGKTEVVTFSRVDSRWMETQRRYSFERESEKQLCALLHFVDAKSGEPVSDDLKVFFDAGDLVEIVFPECDGLEAVSTGCYSWEAFELTVEYCEPGSLAKQAPGMTCVDPRCICTDVQPDGYPAIDPTTCNIITDSSTYEIVSGNKWQL